MFDDLTHFPFLPKFRRCEMSKIAGSGVKRLHTYMYNKTWKLRGRSTVGILQRKKTDGIISGLDLFKDCSPAGFNRSIESIVEVVTSTTNRYDIARSVGHLLMSSSRSIKTIKTCEPHDDASFRDTSFCLVKLGTGGVVIFENGVRDWSAEIYEHDEKRWVRLTLARRIVVI